MDWLEKRRAWTHPRVGVTPARAVDRAEAVQPPRAVEWPSGSGQARPDTRAVELGELLGAFTATFSMAETEILRASGGRMRMLLDESVVEIETRWLRFHDGRFEVAF